MPSPNRKRAVIPRATSTRPTASLTTYTTSRSRRPVLAPRSPAACNARPAWDVKGRLAEMESAKQQLSQVAQASASQLDAMREELAEARAAQAAAQAAAMEADAERTLLAERVAQLDGALDKSSRMLKSEQKRLAGLEREHSQCHAQGHNVLVASQVEMDGLRQEVARLDAQVLSLRGQVHEAQQAHTQAQSAVKEARSEAAFAQAEREEAQAKLHAAESRSSNLEGSLAAMQAKLAAAEGTIAELREKARVDDRLRRKLHNTIQELKGNIRVFCRVRPLLSNKAANAGGGTELGFAFPNTDGKDTLELLAPERSVTGVSNSVKKHPFTFDRVFGPSSSQVEVFDEIEGIIQSSLDGYNTCIFAYGQTGSGKTHTMEGPPPAHMTDESKGVIPRAVEKIFQDVEALAAKGWSYSLSAFYVEIYNETLRDLLADPATPKPKGGLPIRVGETGQPTVPGLTVEPVTSASEIRNILTRAQGNRSTAGTDMNDRSSRSHSVFQLKLIGKNQQTGETVQGLLNLIDLAGSERVNKSNATGDRLTETRAINKSLACLGDVIAALANGNKFVPYRNSKLTQLLSTSLGGNSKTLMFVNVAPGLEHQPESLSSLRFAAKVNKCEIGTAKRNTKINM